MSEVTFPKETVLPEALPALPIDAAYQQVSAGADPAPPHPEDALAEPLPVLPRDVEEDSAPTGPPHGGAPGADLPPPPAECRRGNGLGGDLGHGAPAPGKPRPTFKQVRRKVLIGALIVLWGCILSYLTWTLLGSPKLRDLGSANIMNHVTNLAEARTAAPADLDKDRDGGAGNGGFAEVRRDLGSFLASMKQQFAAHRATPKSPALALNDDETGLPPGVTLVSATADWLPAGVTRL
jgi:hypothetical protein